MPSFLSSASRATTEWMIDRWHMFDWRNLGSIRNLWAIGAGSIFAVGLPLAVASIYLGLPQAVANVLFWPLVVAMWVVAILAVGSHGVAKCRACGTRLRRGHYTCRKCSAVSRPRGMR